MSRVHWLITGVLVLTGLFAPAIWKLVFDDETAASDWPVVAESVFLTPDASWDVVTSEGWSDGNFDVPNYRNEIRDGKFHFFFDLRGGRQGGTFWGRSDEFILANPANFDFEVDVRLEAPPGSDDPEYGFFIEDPDENRVWQF